ncbi:poly(ADP-ribose) glycohydrolase isoform X2 [Girardinichthys multiradiatus]|uniref:poly(ADP-ribose) glycohydrolase isoform X2 n=1 Tax=Girardinichthys multiradiatus TaxID=208333 RepID=UPI001FAD5E9C|nr:poly(ADP-ribose) glycohydrolase isoform X2 [Girardinichthys multiradiatus]
MSGENKRNDSHQITTLLQPDIPENRETKPKIPENRKDSSKKTRSSEPSTSRNSHLEKAGKSSECELRRSQSSEVGSSCCQLEHLKKLPQCDLKLGKLGFTKSHIVLIDVNAFRCGDIRPQEGRDLWHHKYVKLPCSPSSWSPKPDFEAGPVKIKTGPGHVSRWGLISKKLSALASKKAATVEEVKESILKYNPSYKGKWSFDALAMLGKPSSFETHFETLFPKIAALALKLPEQVKKAIPLLQHQEPASITLSQVQISCLLANAFYCTFPHRNTTRPDAEYRNFPSINFTRLFGNQSERKTQKLHAIMQYFNVVTDEKSKPEGLVTFERRCLTYADVPKWEKCNDTMQKLHVTSKGEIEVEGKGMLQVDFAASWIGGGVLDSGLVQEEILFLINPELIVSRLFTEKLDDNECLIITGTQQFSCYSGFSDSFKWIGPYDDDLERDEWGRLKRQILAIDALHFRHPRDQYNMAKIRRELNKAYCGFKGHHDHQEPDIATGKWGCGAFNGDPELKGQLYEYLEDYCIQRKPSSRESLFDFLRNTIINIRSLL